MSLPSTASLRAFEASSRLLSFTDAARELSQTQGAISHQIRELETRLGKQLFDRLPRGIALTDAGNRYLPYACSALETLNKANSVIQGSDPENSLSISCSPNFAQKWLTPRIGSFLEQQPSLNLSISAAAQHIDFQTSDIDIAVRHGDGNWPDLSVTRLSEEWVFPVCSPMMQPEWSPDQSVRELGTYTLLHDEQREGWSHWLDQVGISPDGFKLDQGPVFSQTSLAIDGAVAGQGVALARSSLVSLDLDAGKLLRPVQEKTAADFAYWIVCAKKSASQEKVVLLKNWLLEQA